MVVDSSTSNGRVEQWRHCSCWHVWASVASAAVVRAVNPDDFVSCLSTASAWTASQAAALCHPLLCAVLCVQVAGLDVGWHTLLDLQENPKTKRLEVTREVLPGTYPFKFIIDGRWVANHDYPTYLVSGCAPRPPPPPVLAAELQMARWVFQPRQW